MFRIKQIQKDQANNGKYF